MIPRTQTAYGRLLILIVLLAALGACRSAPLVDYRPEPIHVIEIGDVRTDSDEPLAARTLLIEARQNVIWLNTSSDTRLRIEVVGSFDEPSIAIPADRAEACFEVTADGAHTRDALAPGDAAALRFAAPGIYRYRVMGTDPPVEGRIIVREASS